MNVTNVGNFAEAKQKRQVEQIEAEVATMTASLNAVYNITFFDNEHLSYNSVSYKHLRDYETKAKL